MRNAEHGHVAEAVAAEHAAEIFAGAVPLPGEQVDLVEHHEHRRRVPRQGLQVALVEGRVGVFLRVETHTNGRRRANETVDLRAVSRLDDVEGRQVEEHQAGGRIAVEPVP